MTTRAADRNERRSALATLFRIAARARRSQCTEIVDDGEYSCRRDFRIGRAICGVDGDAGEWIVVLARTEIRCDPHVLVIRLDGLLEQRGRLRFAPESSDATA